MTRSRSWQTVVAVLLVVPMLFALGWTGGEARQAATPVAASCDAVGTPAAGAEEMSGMDHGNGHDQTMPEFDQSYIDMMIPHHGSIIVLAQTALPHLTDPRLVTIAENIITAQVAEIDQLRGLREHLYGSPDPVAVTEAAMQEMMVGLTVSMDEMMAQMDAEAQVAAFCDASNPDLAFIDLTIPHHESAITASEAALRLAIHPEIRTFAEGVIAMQEREIAELKGIRRDVDSSATPEAGDA